MDNPQPGGPEPNQRWETIAIILSVVALWPRVILKWPNPIWDALLYIVLGVMIVIAALRIQRIRNLRKQKRDRQ